ncbi:helix-turn-helix domain-containing protein [Hyalangium versicolor]|uniref:helix-turn-helix domain-containing protein n=1 Tax=Hyalangium versicolor TaxID=2861190 RepID=UPI001CCA9919|nr:helix-turn-helix domain-containing protein [Hyalangium versicolor]
MAELLQQGAVLISTDALVCAADADFSGPALTALQSVSSDFPIKHEADAIFTSRARVYGLLQRVESIRPGERVLAQDATWAVVRVARHASIESKPEFAETILMCLQSGSAEAAPVRKRKRLMSAEETVRVGKRINDEVEEEGRTLFRWDHKRRLKDRDVNPFVAWSDTQPYASGQRKVGADRQRKVRAGQAREELAPLIRTEVAQIVRRHLSEARQDYHQPVQSKLPLMTVKEIAAHCGVTEQTVRDWIKAGYLPARRPGAGRIYRIRREDLDAFLLKRPQIRGEAAPDVSEQVERILRRVRGKARNEEG